MSSATDDDPEVTAAAFAVRDELFDHERETVTATHTFGGAERVASEEERAATLERALAEIETRERCGEPTSTQHELIEGAGDDAPLVFFTGSIPTDAGGVGDMSTWGELVVRLGCDWKKVDIVLTASPLRRFRDPTGRRVLVQSRVVGQCSSEVRVFTVSSAKSELLFRTEEAREDMVGSGVCEGGRAVEPIEVDGVLQGFRMLDCHAKDPCTLIEEARFAGRSLAVARPQ